MSQQQWHGLDAPFSVSTWDELQCPAGMQPPREGQQAYWDTGQPRGYPLWAHGCGGGACVTLPWRGAGTCVGVSLGRWVLTQPLLQTRDVRREDWLV